jgi:cell surface protein SprA
MFKKVRLHTLGFTFAATAALFTLVWASSAKPSAVNFLNDAPNTLTTAIDTPSTDTIIDPKLRYEFEDHSYGDPTDNPEGNLFLTTPSNVKTTYNYDPDSNLFYINETMGNLNYRNPTYMTLDEYMAYQKQQNLKDYWKKRQHADNLNAPKKNGLVPKLYINNIVFDRIFGGNTVDIRPNGSAELIFGVNVSKTDNPSLPIRQRRVSTFDFNEKIQLNVIGKIGDKLKLTTNYNTEASFDFENQMKLEYTGYEDDIIKKIEAGNVNLPLSGSLITGSQSLFGIKTQMQFGKMTVTSVLSQQRGKKSEIEVTGGAQTTNFEIKGDNYEASKHYFLAHYFRDTYNQTLSGLPVIQTGINVTKVEVWITNTSASTNDTRDILALTDLGESTGRISNTIVVTSPNQQGTLPANNVNNIDPSQWPVTQTTPPPIHPKRDPATVVNEWDNAFGMDPVKDFEKVTLARKLTPNEFTFNPKLGYISLNTQLNPDQVLAVAFQYTINGNTYQVGEFSTDGVPTNHVLYVKLLKGTIVSPRANPLLWDLMMKNIYALGAYQVRPESFKLEILYNNPGTGTYVNVLPETNLPLVTGKPLINVMGLDNINTQLYGAPDGVFDFIEGVTINPQNGRLIFPVVEPFGQYLNDKIVDNNINNQTTANKYTYQQLYDSTKIVALQFPEKNRFIFRGSYKSASGSDISLNAANVPQGSVTVTAGGVPLTENVDYTVDYALGKVKIINEGILQSGTPIKISLESNSLFSIQQRTMMGARFDYRVNKDFTLGSTILRLGEKPLTQKVNIGDEPIRNTVVGLDGNYRTEAPWLTRIIDKLPLLSTKEMSTITTSFEVAKFFPGHARAIGKEGNSYIDDFEGSQTTIDIKNWGAWTLSSVPQGNNPNFPEAGFGGTASGFNRAKLAWYIIDPIFLRAVGTGNNVSDYIDPVDQSNNLVREILETEIFPNKQQASGQPINIPTLDLSFYPNEVGPYNYDTTNITFNSQTNQLLLTNPDTRWGGIMRKIETNDWEAANVEFIQFWVMDPFVRDLSGNSTDYQNYFGTTPPLNGELYIDIGNISEDILKDGKKSFENGLPTPFTALGTDNTPWGKVPQIQSLVFAFSNGSNENETAQSRTAQDIGLDGLDNNGEATYFNLYMAKVNTLFGTAAFNQLQQDPSHDKYHYFRGNDYDTDQRKILFRYKDFNGMEGNSPVAQSNEPYPTSATTIPNTEDVNRDNNLSETEGYFEYKVKINPTDINPFGVGNNYITSVYQASTTAVDGTTKTVNWYQFKIPVKEFLPQNKFGNIEDFRSIRFMRMYLKGFDKPIVLRFARLDLVRGEWRKYAFDLLTPGEYIPVDNNSGTSFDISAVNYEENGTKTPVNYVLPPQIQREVDIATANLVRLNEQSLSMKVCGLKDGDSRACFKNVDLDVRSYKTLKMFIHAESFPGQDNLEDKDLNCFIRLGTDYTDNYYEYEIPLYVTAPGVYNTNDDNDKRKVWLEKNDMILKFADLQTAKQQRNSQMQNPSSGVSLNSEYVLTITDAQGNPRIIRIKGNPNLSTIKTIMIGVRNPKRTGTSDSDDGLDKCAEVWVNELRLTDFDELGGWAATSRITAKLADFGTFSISGNLSTPGWGSIEKRVSERKRETTLQYDIATQLNLGKLIHEKYNIQIPVFIGFSQGRINPQFNPFDPDIELKNIYNSPELSQEYKDSIRKVVQDFSQRKSINLTNVKKDKGKGKTKSHIYDVENFALNLSYSEYYNRSATVTHFLTKNYRGGITYNYRAQPKNIKPFGKTKSKWMSKKGFAFLKDFNFYPYPNMLSFITDVDRYYSERLVRNITQDQFLVIDTTFEKRWNWNRAYDLNYDIAKSLKLVYSADNLSQIREPDGKIDTQTEKNSIRDEVYKFGTTTKYGQRVKIDYTIPINKFPLLDWVTSTTSYTGGYDWARSSFNADTLGNLLSNNNSKTLNVQMNMPTLYNRIPYFKKVNQKVQKKQQNNGKDGNGKGPNKPPPPTNTTPQDTTKKKKKDDNSFTLPEYIVRTIMLIKNVSVSYTENGGMIIPGYTNRTVVMGMNPNTPFSGAVATPGLGFVFGDQRDPRTLLEENNLLSKYAFNNLFTKTRVQNISGRANIEPIPDFKIELTANRNFSKNFSEMFQYDAFSDEFLHLSPLETGNFSMSFQTWRTAFEKQGKDFSSKTFQRFLDSRNTISFRLHDKNPDNSTAIDPNTNFWEGYGKTSQEVMMFAFLSAYSGSNENTFTLNTFPTIPKPNWRLTYDGLAKVPAIKKHFKTFTVSHAYRSSMSFNYTTNLLYQENNGGASATDITGNLIVKEQINSVSFSEQFAPLFKIDMAMNKRLTGNVELKRDRNVSLSFANSQITELNGREYIFGVGYRIPELQIKYSKQKGKKPLKSDLVLRSDINIRKNTTVIRKIVEEVTQPTAGQTVISIKFTADYVISDKLNIRIFYDQVLTRPAISTSYNSSNINSGVSIRFALSQ